MRPRDRGSEDGEFGAALAGKMNRRSLRRRPRHSNEPRHLNGDDYGSLSGLQSASVLESVKQMLEHILCVPQMPRTTLPTSS